jgi:hypothetical protein
MAQEFADLLTDVIIVVNGRGHDAYAFRVSEVMLLAFGDAHHDFIPALEVSMNRLQAEVQPSDVSLIGPDIDGDHAYTLGFAVPLLSQWISASGALSRG